MNGLNLEWLQVLNATCPLLFNSCKSYSQREDQKTLVIINVRTFFKIGVFLFALMFSANLVKAQVTFTVTAYGNQVYPGPFVPGGNSTGIYTCSPTFPIPNSGPIIYGVVYHLVYPGLSTQQSYTWDNYVYTASSNITSYTFPFSSPASNAGTGPLMVKIYDANNTLINVSNYTLETLNPCPNTYTFLNYSTTEKCLYKNLTTNTQGDWFSTLFKITSTVPFKKIEFRHGYPLITNPNTAVGVVYLYASNYSTGFLCKAGTTAPAVTPTTASNSCPSTTVNLASLAVSSTTPSGAKLIWSTHKTPTSAADTLTTAQKTAVSTAGKYYALYYDATNGCYSPADSVTLSINTCLSASNPAAQTATTGAAKTGNAATELAPTGGTSPYIYSDGAGDAACVAPSGATALTGLTVNADGTYSYTAPAAAGTYYYCVKVCDSATPTASCIVKTYTLTVTAAASPLTANTPAAQTATTGAAKTGNAATELSPTGGISPYIYSNVTFDPACIASSGATALTGLTVNANGMYSYSAPTTAGTYYYCIKVCDSATPTASCIVKTYTLTVTAAAAPISITNTCPTATVNLMTAISATNVPSGATVTWHNATPATNDTKVTDPTAISTSGTYYLAFFDGGANCYSDVSQSVTVTITSCVTPLTASNPAAQTATTGAAKTGNAATELAPTGGTSPYTYSNGAGDAACVAPSGATALPAASNLTVNSSTGAYTYTAPAAAGTYYYCVKVCDSATPTASCVVKTYTLTVTAAAACTVSSVVPTFIKN